MSQSLANQKALAAEFLQIEATWNVDDVVSIRTPDCKHQLLPQSLGDPVRSNDELKLFYGEFAPLWKGYKIDLIKAIHDAEEHQSVLHIMNHAGTDVGPFDIETMFVLHFTNDGKQLKRVEEYVDTKYFGEFMQRLGKTGSM